MNFTNLKDITEEEILEIEEEIRQEENENWRHSSNWQYYESKALEEQIKE